MQPTTADQLQVSVVLDELFGLDGRLSSPVASEMAVTAIAAPPPPGAPGVTPVGAWVSGAKVMLVSAQAACPVRVSFIGA